VKYLNIAKEQLRAWVAEYYGPDAVLSGVSSLGGHSGVTVGFVVKQVGFVCLF